MVAGCNIGHKPCLLRVSGWDRDQVYKINFLWIFLKDDSCRLHLVAVVAPRSQPALVARHAVVVVLVRDERLATDRLLAAVTREAVLVPRGAAVLQHLGAWRRKGDKAREQMKEENDGWIFPDMLKLLFPLSWWRSHKHWENLKWWWTCSCSAEQLLPLISRFKSTWQDCFLFCFPVLTLS